MKWLDKYKKSFVMGMQVSLEYRLSFILSMISTVFPIIIQVFLWKAIFHSASNSTVYGYSYPQIIMYTIMAGLVAKLVSTGFEYEINGDIKNGGLNTYIVRPIDYFSYRLFRFIGEKILFLVLLLLISFITLRILNVLLGLEIKFNNVLMFIFVLFLSIILNFLLHFSIGILAFWLTEVSRLFGTINIILIIISGGIFPLDIFGANIVKLIKLLPFAYTIQFPINTLSGKLAQGEISQGIIIQLLWTGLLVIISNTLWKKGLKKYVAVGG